LLLSSKRRYFLPAVPFTLSPDLCYRISRKYWMYHPHNLSSVPKRKLEVMVTTSMTMPEFVAAMWGTQIYILWSVFTNWYFRMFLKAIL
jgi:hypothetical protein